MTLTVNEIRTAPADRGGAASTSAVYPADWIELDTKAVDTARVLAADAVEKVGNGHPGTAMSLAPLAYTLFQRIMRHDPSETPTGSAGIAWCSRVDIPASRCTPSCIWRGTALNWTT